MLQRTRNTFFLDIDESINHETPTITTTLESSNNERSSSSSTNPIGLGILIDDSSLESNIKSNVIFKPIFVIIGSSTTRRSQISSSTSFSHEDSKFLKTCCLCRKKLTPQMDVFMYRGDQGFCSDDCRCRQILIDEIREDEAFTSDIFASSRQYFPNNVPKAGVSGRGGRVSAAA